MSDILILISLSIVAFIMFLIIICVCCKVSGECSRKEEQEEVIRRLNGKEYMLDDYRIEDELVYDDEFIRKEDKQNVFKR